MKMFRVMLLVLVGEFFGFSLEARVDAATLPADIKWETNDKEPVFADSQAVKGGTANAMMATFPLTFRTVGPDANSILYLAQINNQLSLTTLHPNTENPIPVLATHWAYGKDGRSVYYKINPEARWSDGKPVTADDFVFTLEFMLSKHLVAPWYNTYYSETFEKVEKIDDHTLLIVLRSKKPRLLYYADLSPTPRHFYGGKVDPDFVKKYNWSIVPNPGPYQITKFDKGKTVTFERKKDWWGQDLKYFKHRFNVDKIVFWVVRDTNLEYEWFKAGKLDFFSLSDPNYWHERYSDKVFQKGYVERLWFYNDAPRGTYGFWLNRGIDLFKDQNVRLGIAYSMNFEKMLSTVLRNEFVRLETIADGYGPYVNKTIKALPFDLKKADEHFKAAGWEKRGPDGIRVKGGKRLAASVMYSHDLWTPRLVLLREEARKAGFELNLKKMDWAAVLKATSAWKHEIVLMGFSGFMFPSYWDQWHSKAEDNLTATKNPEIDKVIDAYRAESDEKKRHDLSKKIQQLVHNEYAFIPSVTTDWAPRIGMWRWWRFPKPAGTKQSQSVNSLFDTQYGGLMWIDPQRYEETQKAQKDGKGFTPVTTVDETYRKKVHH